MSRHNHMFPLASYPGDYLPNWEAATVEKKDSQILPVPSSSCIREIYLVILGKLLSLHIHEKEKMHTPDAKTKNPAGMFLR